MGRLWTFQHMRNPPLVQVSQPRSPISETIPKIQTFHKLLRHEMVNFTTSPRPIPAPSSSASPRMLRSVISAMRAATRTSSLHSHGCGVLELPRSYYEDSLQRTNVILGAN